MIDQDEEIRNNDNFAAKEQIYKVIYTIFGLTVANYSRKGQCLFCNMPYLLSNIDNRVNILVFINGYSK